MEKLEKSDSDWKKILPKEKYKILRLKGTERAFTGKFDKFYEPGTYSCGGCGEELFTSDQKYDSGCGWPAFFDAIPNKIKTEVDRSYGMVRTEIMCAKCDGHLGHVFEDGPRDKTGLRYCVNSLSLDFKPM